MARTRQKKHTENIHKRKTRNMRKKQGGGEIMDISFFTNPSNLVCTPITINDDLKNIIFPLYMPVISSTDTTQQETINHVNRVLKWSYKFREDIHDDNNDELNNFFIMTIDTENNSVIINDLNIRTEKTEIELKFIFDGVNIVLNYKDQTIPVQIAYDENNKYGYFDIFKRLCIGSSLYDTIVSSDVARKRVTEGTKIKRTQTDRASVRSSKVYTVPNSGARYKSSSTPLVNKTVRGAGGRHSR